MDNMSEPNIGSEPSELEEALDGTLAVNLGAVLLFFEDLCHMGVKRDSEPARQMGGFDHQSFTADRERARRDPDSHHGSIRGVVEFVAPLFHALQNGVGVLDELVRRTATGFQANVDGTAGGVKAQAELPGRRDLGPEHSRAGHRRLPG